MKKEYDLSKMKSRKNPYASKLKKPVSHTKVLLICIFAIALISTAKLTSSGSLKNQGSDSLITALNQAVGLNN